ncbi:unnamed protein product [Rangifer tarandus platyrhynchus]|uniref:Uncharacterized protein n=1 Tax=Rangifer tarandus platyrhynchus TaxID=3082113 RepID=A0AC60A1V0_RANTA
MQAGEKPEGGAALSVEWGGEVPPKSLGINYCLGARVTDRAAAEVQRPPSRPPAPPPKESRGGGRRRNGALTFAHLLTHTVNSLTKLPAVAAPHSPFSSPPLPSPLARPIPSPPLLPPTVPPQVSGEITAVLFSAALKSRERSDNSAQTAGEVERVRR